MKISAKIGRRSGATVMEYAVLFVVVVTALVGVSVYLNRAISGKWKQAADVFGYGRISDGR